MTIPTVILFVAGLVLLTVGAELIVGSAARIATRLGVPSLVVGLTIVAFGTSAPEIAVSARAAIAGNGDVSIGNVVGSNIFNVLFILGLSALMTPLVIERQLVKLDVPVLIAVSTLPLLLGLDRRLGSLDGIVLLCLGVLYTVLLARLALRDRRRGATPPTGPPGAGVTGPTSPEGPAPLRGSTIRDILYIAVGLVALVQGSAWLVEGAATIARAMGISDLVIGLTLVAAGTSLPEVATSIVAALRGERDLAVGNVVGSNIFNVLFVLGVAGVAGPDGVAVSNGVLALDFPFMIAVAVVCLPIFLTGWLISRVEGAAFLIFYGLYLVYLGLHAADHPLEDEYRFTVLGFVLPLTLAVASAGWIRNWRRGR